MVVYRCSRTAVWVFATATWCALWTAACLAQETAHLYVFSMPTCVPCRQMEPDVDRMIQAGYPVTKVDCVANEAWARHFQITQAPTTILVVGQQVASRTVGPQSYDQLVAAFDSVGFRPANRNPQTAAPANVAVVTQLSAQTSLAPARDVAQPVAPAARSNNWTEPKHLAHQATVRIKVEDPQGISYATGTVIHRHGDEYLAITCGHVFRESRGTGTISVETGFAGGQPQTTQGQLLRYESEARDVGLISFHSAQAIEPVRIAPLTMPVSKGDQVFSFGCDHGDQPSLRDTQILRTAIYDGATKYDIVGRPVDGRSGGGLFSAGGQLIGVCNAAAVEEDEGVYSSLENIYWQLDTANLAHLFQSSAPAVAQTESPTPQRAAAIATTPRTGAPNTGNVEIIMVVRSKDNPELAETYTVQQPSQELLGLVQAMRSAEQSGNRTASNRDQYKVPAQSSLEAPR